MVQQESLIRRNRAIAQRQHTMLYIAHQYNPLTPTTTTTHKSSTITMRRQLQVASPFAISSSFPKKKELKTIVV